MDNNITFSKIVATPTLNSWSQAYSAGKLFAVLSLEKTEESSEIESLNIIGKDLLERLEQEFFAIENKDLDSIKKAIAGIFEKSIEGVSISFAAGAIINNVLYLFSMGNGRVFMKRNGALGLILDSEGASLKEVVSSSGFLKEEDLIVLTTNGFSEVITRDDLNAGLNSAEPTEITESLAPKIHRAENGKVSAIIIKYNQPQLPQELIETEETEKGEEAPPSEDSIAQTNGSEEREVEKQTANIDRRKMLGRFVINLYAQIKSKLKKPNFKVRPTKKLFLVAAVIIIGIFIYSIFSAIQAQNNAKIKALFDQIYPQAQKKYDEGQSLVDLNKNLAYDSFLAAQKLLNDNKNKFPVKSIESTQTQDLLTKITSAMAQVSPIDKSGLDRSKLTVTVENGSGVEGVAGKAADVLKTFGYNIVSTGNADNYDYQGVTIKVKSDQKDFVNLLKQDLSKDYTVTASSSDLPSDSSTQAIVIIGK
jgi:hypothetical protein